MLSNWEMQPLDFGDYRIHFPSYLKKDRPLLEQKRPTADMKYRPEGPVHQRWVTTVRTGKSDDGTLRTWAEPQPCIAFFDSESPDILHLATEGDLFVPDATIMPGDTNRQLSGTQASVVGTSIQHATIMAK